jgi:hypothetical protein
MFRGPYKSKDNNGAPITYMKGDVVLYQGKVYQCKNQIHKTPLQSPKSWKYIGITENFISETPPVDPKEGQKWISGNGTEYVWYKDGNSFQWIEI